MKAELLRLRQLWVAAGEYPPLNGVQAVREACGGLREQRVPAGCSKPAPAGRDDVKAWVERMFSLSWENKFEF